MNKRRTQPAHDEPVKSVLVSGDVERDAQYVMLIGTKALRRHELWRLGHIHGDEHREAVEARVTELWDEAHPELAKAA